MSKPASTLEIVFQPDVRTVQVYLPFLGPSWVRVRNGRATNLISGGN
jgi:hypothetical protein